MGTDWPIAKTTQAFRRRNRLAESRTSRNGFDVTTERKPAMGIPAFYRKLSADVRCEFDAEIRKRAYADFQGLAS